MAVDLGHHVHEGEGRLVLVDPVAGNLTAQDFPGNVRQLENVCHWLTVMALVLSLMVGTTALLSGLVMSFQHYFEAQVQEGLKMAE